MNNLLNQYHSQISYLINIIDVWVYFGRRLNIVDVSTWWTTCWINTTATLLIWLTLLYPFDDVAVWKQTFMSYPLDAFKCYFQCGLDLDPTFWLTLSYPLDDVAIWKQTFRSYPLDDVSASNKHLGRIHLMTFQHHRVNHGGKRLDLDPTWKRRFCVIFQWCFQMLLPMWTWLGSDIDLDPT